MAKQILIGITEQELSEIAHYLMIYFPYNEEMCSYTDAWMGELYENKYPLVAKGRRHGLRTAVEIRMFGRLCLTSD